MNRTILIIDDEKEILNMYQILLKKFNYHVLTADSGKSAMNVEKNYGGDIDIVLLDVHLPDINCYSLYSALTDKRPGLRVIVCTGDPYNQMIQEMLDAGAADFIQKPFSIMDLSSRIDHLMIQ